MKRIPAFQTTDNQTFADEGEALDHQLVLDLRGLLHRAASGSAADNANSPTAAAKLFAKEQEEGYKIFLKHRQRKAGYESRKAKMGQG